MVDVIIAGAGPVGLFLAGELALAGCSAIVLESDERAQSSLKSLPLGLRGLNAASVESLYRRGLLDSALDASGLAPDDVGTEFAATTAPPPRSLAHFAGITLDVGDIDVNSLHYRLPSPAMEGMMTSLEAIVTVLTDRAVRLGVKIVRGESVSGVEERDDQVLVTTASARYRAGWLVGCDGGRSAVRKLAGFDFVGSAPLLTGYIANVSLANPKVLETGFNLTPSGMYIRAPFDGYLAMMDFDGGSFDRTRELSREHLQSVLQRVSESEAIIETVHSASSFTDRSMQVTNYRRGRVLLAGDAAHIHSPLGGQGLNLGIGDAMNLGWKLASVINGRCPEELIDTYSLERHPIGEKILDWSRAQVAVMQPGPNSAALRKLSSDLLSTRDGTTHSYKNTSGIWHRYELGSEHPLVGRTAPDFCLSDGRRLGEILQNGRGVVLDFTSGRRIEALAQGWKGRVQYVAGRPERSLGIAAVLVRPDGIVAWLQEGDDLDARGFTASATTWFGHQA